MSTPTPSSAPYHGSCHCKSIKYIVFLTLPPSTSWVGHPSFDAHFGITRSYKCNCTICHKTGFFHVRPTNSPSDFMLLSPLDLKELGDYTCIDHELHWYFCRNCGVRCFTLMGEGEVVDVELEEMGIKGAEKGSTRAWRPKGEGWKENKTGYLSVNALTLGQGQEGLDLREWVEKKCVGYEEMLFEKVDERVERPHEGGAY